MNPVRIRGVDYPSQSAAARKFGVSPAVINQRLDHGSLENLGVTIDRSKPVTIRDVTYPSQLAAAAALGVSPPTIRYHMHAGTLQTIGLPRRPNNSGTGGFIITIDGVTYRSVYAACRLLGITRAIALKRGELESRRRGPGASTKERI